VPAIPPLGGRPVINNVVYVGTMVTLNTAGAMPNYMIMQTDMGGSSPPPPETVTGFEMNEWNGQTPDANEFNELPYNRRVGV